MQNLALDLCNEARDRAIHVALLARHAERGVGERDQRLHPRHAIRRLERGVAQITDLPRQAAQEAAIELIVGIMQDQRRLAQPVGNAARENLRAPAELMEPALKRDPLVDQRACVGAGDAGLGGAQMAEPSEAQERRGPFLRRRRNLEWRAAVADHHLAGEGEAASVNLARSRAVGGVQILRRDHQPVGFARKEIPADERMATDAPSDMAQAATPQEQGQLDPLRDRQARHLPVRLYDCRGRPRPRSPQGVTYSEGADSGQPWRTA